MGSDELAVLAARNAATAPPFSAATLEKLAVLLGPAAAEVRRRRPRRPANRVPLTGPRG